MRGLADLILVRLAATLSVASAFVQLNIALKERLQVTPLSGAAVAAATEVIRAPARTPRSRYWKDSAAMKESSVLDLKNEIQLETATEIAEQNENANPTAIETLYRNNNRNTVVAVEITTALSEEEATQIKTLAETIRQESQLGKSQFEHRSFGTDKGGNDCTYLAPLLQLLLPQTAAKVVSIAQLAWEEADWGVETENLPSPTELGIRTSEHLCYDGWKSLEPHKDVGSIYTCNIALKEPEDYEGGEFFLHTSFFDQTEIKPQRLSAVVFLSDTTHGVRPITAGSRESFVTEFWDQDDAPLGMNRPTPEEWEAFLKKQ